MNGFFKFIGLFETTLVTSAPAKIIRDPVKVEFFQGPRSINVPVQTNMILPKGEDFQIARSMTLNLPDDHRYLLITVQTKEAKPDVARKFCEDALDKMITNLAILYGHGLFARLIYRGWIDEKNMIAEAWVQVADPFQITEVDLLSSLDNVIRKQKSDADILRRYSLMSRFYSKSLFFIPSEEKFIDLWTILEIFPMKDQTNIKPIGEYLGSIIGKSSTEVKEKLWIGRLYGLRTGLVHNGLLDIEITKMGDVFTLLEEICIEVMKGLCGVPYKGLLDKYFD